MADQVAFYDYVRARQSRLTRRAERTAKTSLGHRIFDNGVAQIAVGLGLSSRGQPKILEAIKRVSPPARTAIMAANLAIGFAKYMVGSTLAAPYVTKALSERIKLSGMKTSQQVRSGRATLAKKAGTATLKAMRAPTPVAGGRPRTGGAAKPGGDGFTKGYTRRSSSGRSVTVKGYSTPKR